MSSLFNTVNKVWKQSFFHKKSMLLQPPVISWAFPRGSQGELRPVNDRPEFPAWRGLVRPGLAGNLCSSRAGEVRTLRDVLEGDATDRARRVLTTRWTQDFTVSETTKIASVMYLRTLFRKIYLLHKHQEPFFFKLQFRKKVILSPKLCSGFNIFNAPLKGFMKLKLLFPNVWWHQGMSDWGLKVIFSSYIVTQMYQILPRN